MSMRDYAVDDYGIVLGGEEFAFLAKKYPDLEDDIDFIGEEVSAEYISEFTGEANLIDENGNEGYGCESIDYSDDAIYYFPIGRYSTLFSAAFSCMEVLVTEMKYKYGKYLPDDYDYAKNIRHIVGTYYG